MTDETGNIQAVVFDMDDTLYGEANFVRSGYHAVGAALRTSMRREDAFEQWMWDRFLAGQACGVQAAGAFDALSEHFSLGLEASDIRRLVDVYRFHEPDIHPFAGIPELLDKLSARFSLGLLSDGPGKMQRNKLRVLGLADRFDVIVLTGELDGDAGKPAPDGFLLAAESLGVPHGACVYIADNPAKDFLGPNRLGWRTIQYHRDGQVHAHKPPPPGGSPGMEVRDDRALLEALGF